MSHLKIFRAEATERLTLYREASDEQKALKEILGWLAEQILKSYRNGQEGRKGKQEKRR